MTSPGNLSVVHILCKVFLDVWLYVDAGLSEYTLLCHYNHVSDTVPVLRLRISTHPHAVRCVMSAAIGQAY